MIKKNTLTYTRSTIVIDRNPKRWNVEEKKKEFADNEVFILEMKKQKKKKTKRNGTKC